MQLLLSRKQKQGFVGVNFSLWAKFDLTPEEMALVVKYKVGNATLIPGNRGRDLRLAALPALGATIIVYFLVLAMPAPPFRGWTTFILFLGVVFCAMLFVFYHIIREQVIINDIINGRWFTCRSVISLLEKEELFVDMGVKFRRLLEYMKNWGGKEIVPIELSGVISTQMIERRDEAA